MSEQGQPHPSRSPMSTPMWPLWVIVGGVVIALIAVLVRGGHAPDWPSADRNFPPTRTQKPPEEPPPPPVPVDCQGLASGSSYALSADANAVGAVGGDPAGEGVKTFPAGSVIVVSSVRADGNGAKWYYVMAKDANGQQIGFGWIAADWLAGQNLTGR